VLDDFIESFGCCGDFDYTVTASLVNNYAFTVFPQGPISYD